jgi:hypothetical protein
MGMGGAIGKIGGTLNLPGGIASKLSAILQGGDERDAFNGILLATVAHVNNKPNFNLELEINELLIRLGNLRGASSEGIGGALSQVARGLSENIDKAMGSLIKGN